MHCRCSSDFIVEFEQVLFQWKWKSLNIDSDVITTTLLHIKRQSSYPIETSQMICRANQLAGFYMMATLTFNELKRRQLCQ